MGARRTDMSRYFKLVTGQVFEMSYFEGECHDIDVPAAQLYGDVRQMNCFG